MIAKPLVAATDGSEESLRAVEWAAREAVVRGAPLRIVSAVQVPAMIGLQVRPDRDFVADLIHQERDQAFGAAAARAAEVAPGLQVDTVPLSGPPAQAVTASGSGASMLVLGSRGSGAFGWMAVGSVSRYAAAHACCPVVVIRGETAAVHRQVGIGIGDLEACADSLTFAFEEASLRKASLMAIHALHLPAPREPGTWLPSKPTPPGSSPDCWTPGGTSTPTSRSARMSCTATRAGRWSAYPPGPTWWSSAGTPSTPCQVLDRSGTPS